MRSSQIIVYWYKIPSLLGLKIIPGNESQTNLAELTYGLISLVWRKINVKSKRERYSFTPSLVDKTKVNPSLSLLNPIRPGLNLPVPDEAHDLIPQISIVLYSTLNNNKYFLIWYSQIVLLSIRFFWKAIVILQSEWVQMASLPCQKKKAMIS